MDDFAREQRLKALKRARQHWQILTDVSRDWLVQEEDPRGPQVGDAMMLELFDAIEINAKSESLVDFEDMELKIHSLSDYVASKGGSGSMFAKRVKILRDYMGATSEGIPDMDYNGVPTPADYFFWLDLCNQLAGLGPDFPGVSETHFL
jgi:hypothetical protein